MRGSARRRALGTASKVIAVALLVVYAALSVFPFLVMLGGSFKTNRDLIEDPWPWPKSPTWDTVIATASAIDVFQLLFNTIVIAAGSCLLILVVFPLAGYAFAILRFPGRNVLFLLFVASIFVPAITTLLPTVLIAQKLGLYGSPLAVILPLVSGAAPLAILLLRAFFTSLPAELHESAVLDGCSEFAIFWRIYLPLARPALVTLTIVNTVAAWNEFVLPALTNDDPTRFPLSVGLESMLTSTSVVQWNQIMAGALIMVIPVIIAFALLQRYFINGLQGSIKG